MVPLAILASIGLNDSSSAMDLMTSLKSSITDPDGNEKDANVSSGSTGNANGGNVIIDADEGSSITDNGASFRAGNGGTSVSGDAISGNGSKGDGANFGNEVSGGSFTSSLNDAFSGSTVHASNRVR
ncbi:hypothetical protein ACEPAI_3728 [Sanghuangporus weigelae]